MVNTRSKSGIRKPVSVSAPAPETPKPTAKKPKAAKPKTVRFSDGHQPRVSHRAQGAHSHRHRSPSPHRVYVQASPYGMSNVGHGYGPGYFPPPYGYPSYGYSAMGMSPMSPAPIVDPQQFRYGSTKRSRYDSTDDEVVEVLPAKRNRLKSSEYLFSSVTLS